MPEKFDFIICGGGTAGPVVAARLAEDPSIRVLLLEAGKDSKDMDNMHMPGAWVTLHQGDTDWNLRTPAQPGLQGREIHLPRGKFLGGSSGCNGTICVRGVEQDYDDWNFPQWSGKEMFRAMRKAETFHPKDWFPHDDEAHGWDGPLHIEPGKTIPLTDKVLESYKSFGLPYIPDMFSSGVAANGCGHAVRTQHKGTRSTAADFITKDQEKPNITIRLHATVDKVVVENGEAKYVEYVGDDGHRHTIKAKKEIILSAGTYGSPAILLRSGIGPKSHLEEMGVPVVKDLPGVGENLQDHQLIFVYYELNEPDLTDDARVSHDLNAFKNGYKEWTDTKDGWLASFPFGGFAFARLNDRLEADSEEWRSFPRQPGRDPMDLTETQPNLEFFHTICYGGPSEYTDFPKAGEWAFAMCCFLCGLKGRGEVRLRSRNPRDNPYVNPRYLEDRRDLLMMAEGVKFMNEITMGGAGTKDIVKGGWPAGAEHHLNKTNEDWQSHVQKYASTSYHPGGTCKLGQENDPMAVLDGYAQVYGVRNLRVADCSLMPTLNSGHTQMPAYGIGELVAEFVQKKHGVKSRSKQDV
ncbi:unnamed protein product [Colletotrichum noveboracense]|uniref:Glucose-methanol-choline oxidoreductase N-terminal domain-containing protein n=1 Tax=Colletotrichum noveboracense TaxID=2664923 RepID=A0A9W4WNA8_9PEZI|nr:unnamed protein product [Colletotrichum noveboracense]